MMVGHLGLSDKTPMIENVLFYTKEAYTRATSASIRPESFLTASLRIITIGSLGKEPAKGNPLADEPAAHAFRKPKKPAQNRMLLTPKTGAEKILGVDFFVERYGSPEQVAKIFERHLPANLRLVTISNRGTQCGLPSRCLPTASIGTAYGWSRQTRYADAAPMPGYAAKVGADI